MCVASGVRLHDPRAPHVHRKCIQMAHAASNGPRRTGKMRNAKHRRAPGAPRPRPPATRAAGRPAAARGRGRPRHARPSPRPSPRGRPAARAAGRRRGRGGSGRGGGRIEVLKRRARARARLGRALLEEEAAPRAPLPGAALAFGLCPAGGGGAVKRGPGAAPRAARKTRGLGGGGAFGVCAGAWRLGGPARVRAWPEGATTRIQREREGSLHQPTKGRVPGAAGARRLRGPGGPRASANAPARPAAASPDEKGG